MANPLLASVLSSNKISQAGSLYNESLKDSSIARMTTAGTLNKAILLLIIVFLGGAGGWMSVTAFEKIDAQLISEILITAAIVSIVIASTALKKPKSAKYLSPLFAISQGVFLGVISCIFSNSFADISPNIIPTAVGLTLLTSFIMFIMQKQRILRVADRYKKVLALAIITVAVYYLVTFVISLFNGDTSYFFSSSLISIGISIVIIGIAAFTLILDFQSIENATKMGAPKYMEWYGALSLMVTIVWLYFEILILLGKLAKRK